MKETLEIHLGPQHPSTHGVLGLEVELDGEIIVNVEPKIGFLHRCFEKHAENLSYEQIIPFVDRIDYVAAMNCEHAYVLGVEKMLGITEKIPPRIKAIRVLVAELNRIASHLLAIGTYAIDLGAVTGFLWTFREREHILQLLEWLSGARMLYNYIRVGGVAYELPVNFLRRTRELLGHITPLLEELNVLLTENPIWIQRTANVGVLPLETALEFGTSGPVLRASGLKWDLRKVDGYSLYPELEFEIPVGEGKAGTLGDSWDRFYVRFLEIRESIKICKQVIELLEKKYNTPVDPHATVPKKIRPKKQELYFRAENPRGEMGFYFVADGKSDKPYRLKARGASFSNLMALPEMAKGEYLADLIAILGSIDIVLADVDR